MISIATKGLFWPQAGHGIWSDAGAYGVNELGNQFDFRAVNKKHPKLILRRLSDRDKSCKMKLKIVE